MQPVGTAHPTSFPIYRRVGCAHRLRSKNTSLTTFFYHLLQCHNLEQLLFLPSVIIVTHQIDALNENKNLKRLCVLRVSVVQFIFRQRHSTPEAAPD